MIASEKDLSLPLEKVGVLTIPIALALLTLLIPLYLLHGGEAFKQSMQFIFDTWYFVPVLLAGIVVHELIHGVTWAAFADNGIKSIRFGVQWKSLTPYAHCIEPLMLRHYALGAAMPGLALGFIPFLTGILSGMTTLAMFGVVFTTVACGDLWILLSLRKEAGTSSVKDHPTRAGCIVYQENPYTPTDTVDG